MQQTLNKLQALGFRNVKEVFGCTPTPHLYEAAVHNQEALTAHLGPLVVRTGQYTGRSPKDKFIVEEPGSEGNIWWAGGNQPFKPEVYERLRSRMMAYLQGRDIYVQLAYAGADPRYRGG